MNPTRKLIDDLAASLSQLLPPGMAGLRAELERNFRALLQSRLAKLDLVTREEFEVQREVLRRTRERLSELERSMTERERA